MGQGGADRRRNGAPLGNASSFRAAPLGRDASAEAPLLPVSPDTLVHLGGVLASFVEVYRVTGPRIAWPTLP